jgi:hypothetical protein
MIVMTAGHLAFFVNKIFSFPEPLSKRPQEKQERALHKFTTASPAMQAVAMKETFLF